MFLCQFWFILRPCLHSQPKLHSKFWSPLVTDSSLAPPLTNKLFRAGPCNLDAATNGRKSLPEKQWCHRQTRAIIGGVASAAMDPNHVASPLGYVFNGANPRLGCPVNFWCGIRVKNWQDHFFIFAVENPQHRDWPMDFLFNWMDAKIQSYQRGIGRRFSVQSVPKNCRVNPALLCNTHLSSHNALLFGRSRIFNLALGGSGEENIHNPKLVQRWREGFDKVLTIGNW